MKNAIERHCWIGWLAMAALLAAGCQEPSDPEGSKAGSGDATPQGDVSDVSDASGPAADSATGDAAATPDVDPCPQTAEECPDGQVVYEGTLATGASVSLCVPAFPDCTESEVPDGEGGCKPVTPPCALGALDELGRCVYAKPTCAGGEAVVAGACRVLLPDLSCPPDTVKFPEAPAEGKVWYVKAGAPESGADGTMEHPFPTPASAFGFASKGSTLLLGDGEYPAFNVTKNDVTIRGLCAERTRVVSTVSGKSAIGVAGSGVTIESLGVSGADIGIWVDGASDVTIRKVDASGSTIAGIGLGGANGAHLTDIRATDIQVGQGRRVGILTQAGGSMTVERAFVKGAGGPGAVGVAVVASGQVELTNVTVEGLADGILGEDITGDITVTGSLLEGQTHAGIQLGPPGPAPTATLTVTDTEISGQGPNGEVSEATGILSGMSNLTISVSGSHLHHLAGTGIGMEAGTTLRILGSRFDENTPSDVQLLMSSGALDLEVRNCAFTSLHDSLVVGGAGISGVLVEDSRFASSQWAAPPDGPDQGMSAVALTEVGDFTIRGCVFARELLRESILMQPVHDATIEGNVFLGNGRPPIWYAGLGSPNVAGGSIVVERNHIVAAPRYAITVSEGPATTIRDNLIRETQRTGVEGNAAIAVHTVGTPTPLALVERNTVLGGEAPGISVDGGGEVRDNVVLGVGDTGIHLQFGAFTAERNVVALVSPQELLVEGTSGEAIGRGINGTGASVTLRDNRIAFAGTTGILLSFVSEEVTETSRLVDNWIMGSASDGVFVQMAGADTPVELEGNEIACNHGSGLTAFDSNLSSDGDIVRDTRYDVFKIFANNISVGGSSKVSLKGTTISGALGAGIDASTLPSGSPTVDLVGALVLRNAGGGIDVHQGVSATVGAGTVIRGNRGAGVYVRGATMSLVDATIEDTTAVDGTGEYGDGVQAVLSATVSCEGCQIQGNARAGVFVNASSASLVGCSLVGNAYGIVIQAGGSCEMDATEITGSALSDVLEAAKGEELEVDAQP